MPYRYPFPSWCSAKRRKHTVSTGEGLDDILRRIAGEGVDNQQMLRHLWLNWEMVMGPELAALAFPLGHRKTTLLIGGEDGMVLEELMFQKNEILERVNAFMGRPVFTRIELSLALGRTALTVVPRLIPTKPPWPEPSPPTGMTGSLELDPTSPVGRFHAACLRRFGKS